MDSLSESMKHEARPVFLDLNTVAVIHIFRRYNDINDLWTFEDLHENYEEAAKEFARQIEEDTCEKFKISLIKELIEQVKNEEKRRELLRQFLKKGNENSDRQVM